MSFRYCRQRSMDNNKQKRCWCPKEFCYVDKRCPTAIKSKLFPNSDLYFSYTTCGNDGNKCYDSPDDIVQEGELDPTDLTYLQSLMPMDSFFFVQDIDFKLGTLPLNEFVTFVADHALCTVSSCAV